MAAQYALGPAALGSRLQPFQPAGAAPRPAAGRWRVLPVVAAKKGGKGGGNKKGPGSLMDIPKAKPQGPSKTAEKPWLDTNVIMHNLLLVESYYRKVGKPIMEDVEISQVAKALYEAPFALLAHDGKNEESRFVYGNATALALFECTWDELVGTLSTQSAEPDSEIQTDRSEALRAAAEKGYIDNYEGWRVSFKGRRFRIERATLFNVEAPSGEIRGQACVIRGWEYEDGTKGGELAEEAAAAAPPPTADELVAAEAAVQEQAGVVRQLKEDQGLANSDPQVKAAVAELLARKERAAQLQQRAEAGAAGAAPAEA